MYGVASTARFERSLWKLKRSGVLKASLKNEIDEVILMLAKRATLPISLRDHALSRDMKGYRECHIRGDLLLVYQYRHEKLLLILFTIGSHASLFE